MSAPLATRRVAVAGGGTAGHIFTALEILAAYRRIFGCQGIFIGSAGGLESRLVPDRGERMESIPARPWARQPSWGRLRGAGSIGPAFFASRRILLRERIELVIGTGGYASLAPCLAARALGLRVVIHEANVVPGLANRCLSRIAGLVCVDSELTARHFASSRVAVTGTPSGSFASVTSDPQSPFHFIVLGGSEGSPWLNHRVPPLLGALRRRSTGFTVHHLTGLEDPTAAAAVQSAYDRAGIPARVDEWVTDMGPVYAAATFAIACPGARTLAELSIAGIPALLSPLPGVADQHHTANARFYSRLTGAWFVDEEEWDTEKLAARFESLFSHPETLRAMAEKTRSCARVGAAEKIVREAEALFREAEALFHG